MAFARESFGSKRLEKATWEPDGGKRGVARNKVVNVLLLFGRCCTDSCRAMSCEVFARLCAGVAKLEIYH